MKKWILFIVLLISLCNPVSAQWQATEGIYGDFTTVVADGTIAVATNSAKLFFSTDRGSNWTNISSTLIPQGTIASCLLVNGNHILLGTNIGTFLSTDNGVNWIQTMTARVFSLAMKDTLIFAGIEIGVLVSIDKGNNWGILSGLNSAVFSLVIRDTNIYAGTNDGVFLSTSNGTTWQAINTGLLNNRTPVLAIRTIGTKIFAATYVGIYTSVNNGNTWVLSGLSDKTIHALVVIGTTIFAQTDTEELALSADNGTSWTIVSSMKYLVNSLAKIGTNVFVGTRRGVYFSADNGNNWQQVNKNLSGTRVYNLTTNGGNVFARTVFNGAYLSTNNGANWVQLNNGLGDEVRSFATNGTNIFAGTTNGVYLSTNNGSTWTAANNGLNTTIFSLAISGSNIFAGTANGVYFSNNNGNSWTVVNVGMTNTFVKALSINGLNIFAGTNKGLYLSRDNGMNWTLMNNGLTNTSILSLAIRDSTIWVGTESGVFTSTNNGVNWQKIYGRDSGDWVLGILVNGRNILLATELKGVILLNNFRTVFINDNLPTLNIKSLAISGSYLLAATDVGLFRRPLSEVIVETKEVNQNALSCTISPNPVSNQLTINCSDALISKKYAIKNILGETVKADILMNNTTVLTLNNLSNGMYFLQLIATSNTIKFIKE